MILLSIFSTYKSIAEGLWRISTTTELMII